MLATVYPNAIGFLNQAQPYLEAQEMLNSFVLGLCLRLKSRGEEQQNFYATVADGDQIIAVAMMTPPNATVVASSRNGEELALIAHLLHEQQWAVSGTVGPTVTAKMFAQAWTQLTHRDYQIRIHKRMYELVKVTPPPASSGSIRLATEADRAMVVSWAIAFEAEAVNGNVTEAEAQANFTAKVANQELFLWEDAGQPVTMAARTRPTRHTMSISFVYTPPAFRRRGYASACVATLSQIILDAGYSRCALFTNLANPTSNSIYQKIGYHPVGDIDDYMFVDVQR